VKDIADINNKQGESSQVSVTFWKKWDWKELKKAKRTCQTLISLT